MSSPEQQVRMRNLRTLGALAALFLLPLAIAFWMYYGSDWRPAAQVNHGELITPPRPLPVVTLPGTTTKLLRGRWTLIYIGDGRCAPQCQEALYIMRQTRLALNRDMTRVERLFLATADCCARVYLQREHPGLFVIDATGPDTAALLAAFPHADTTVSLYVVNPLGNLMMRYDIRQNPHGLLEDLQRLLRLSQIG